MVQTGDPTGMEQLKFSIFQNRMLTKMTFFVVLLKKKSFSGSGKGGTSIWGRKFEDEFSEHLKVRVNFKSQNWWPTLILFIHSFIHSA